MGLLDQLFGLQGEPDGWARQMQAQMQSGMISPSPTNYEAPKGLPGSTPPQAGMRKMFPAPDAPKEAPAVAPRMNLGGPQAAPVEEAGVGTYLKGALQGFGGKGGGYGILGAIGGAMNAGDETTRQNELYQTLVAGGIDPRTAQLAIKQPEALKVIQANQEKLKSERKSTELITQRLNALKAVPGMTTEKALAIAQDEVAFREYMKPDGNNPDDNQPAGLLAKGFRYNRETGTMEAVPGGPADQKQVAKQQGDKTALDYTFTGMDRLASSVNALLQNDRGLGRITGAMSVLPNIPGGDAANAQAQLETLKAQVAFQTLQDMRNASKTGGALGQVTERELAMLQNALVPLEQAQSYDQFKKAMQDILKFTQESKGRVRTAYDRIYGGGEGGGLDGSALQGRGDQPLIDQSGFKVEFED
jgi:hypothetical protein